MAFSARQPLMLVPILALFFHALALDPLYRALLYLNILSILLLGVCPRPRRLALPPGVLIFPLCIPLLFILLETGFGEPIAFKEIRHLVSYTCIALLFLAFPQQLDAPQVRRLQNISLVLVLSYVLIQAISVFAFDDRSGITKNTHYLAQYCLLLPFACLFLLDNAPRWKQLVLVIATLLLGIMLIKTSSRTAWLGFLVGGLVLWGLKPRLFHWRVPLALLALVIGAYLANFGNMQKRADDLIGNISKEERVTIWREVAQIQGQSTTKEWIVGHGLDSFKEAFKSVSTYHKLGTDFNAPHNFALELLFTTGIVGAALAVALIVSIYWRLYTLHKLLPDSRYPAVMLAILSANLVFASITISFFSSYNLLILSIIGGILLWQRQLPTTTMNQPKS